MVDTARRSSVLLISFDSVSQLTPWYKYLTNNFTNIANTKQGIDGGLDKVLF